MERSPAVIRYVYGNRLEALADRLIDDLAAAPLSDPMAAEIVLVPHPGIGRWLQQRMAQRTGIAAFLDCVLPAGFVWRSVAQWRPDLSGASGYERESLCWRLYGLLPRLARERGFEPLRDFLGSDGTALRRFELAQALADLYDRYVVYRPQWLARWERGAGAGIEHPHEPWQGALWRVLSQAVGEPARVVLLQEWLSARQRTPGGPQPARISVFGVASLAPLYLEFLAALAQQLPATWYHLNPVSAYWGDDPTARERRRLDQQLAKQGVAEPERHLLPGHPLVESCGEIGRDFVRMLYGLDSIVLDEQPLPPVEDAPRSWLAWLREGMAAQDAGAYPLPPREAFPSLRVHACGSAQREVEILHDSLLDLLQRDPTLTPRDIVVMSPRIEQHAPLIEAVFRQAPEARRLPLTVSDRPAHQSHPLLRAFERLLALPQSRLPLDDVADLLAVPALARRFELDGDAQAALLRWATLAKVRWGLDGGDRAAIGASRYEDFSWLAGLDRLVLGYATGTVAPLQLVGGLSPLPVVEGQAAAALGALWRLVDLLAQWRRRLAEARTARQWQADWNELAQRLFALEHLDEEEQLAWKFITGEIQDWVAAVAAGGGAELALEGDVAGRALQERLRQPPRRTRFLAAGVTVCAMVPMRSVPFRVVCLLGMNDGEFPRREPARSIDLMRAFPAPGDRSRRADDRYLFLEAVLAAGQHLHLSYVRTNPRDGAPREAAAPVLELISVFARAGGGTAPAGLLQHHAAVAYEPAQFDGDPAARSFAGEWLAAAEASLAPVAAAPPFAAASTSADLEPPTVAALALEQVEAFYRQPARDYLRQVLELELPRITELESEEPLSLSGLDAWQADQVLLELTEANPGAGDALLLDQLRARALLPPGQPGEREAARRIACVRQVQAAYERVFGEPRQRVLLQGRLAGVELTARGDRAAARGLVRLRAGRTRGSDWLALALTAQLAGDAEAWILALQGGEPVLGRLDVAALPSAWSGTVLCLFAASRRGFVPLLARSSWEFAHAAAKGEASARRAARQAYEGGFGMSGEREDPHVALLWRDRAEPIDAEFAELALAVYAPLVSALRFEDVA